MIRVAVFGAGAWGINHVRVLASEPGCELLDVVDPDATAAERVRAIAPSARCRRTRDEVLGDPDIDAVVIASPAPTHTELVRAAFAAGKHTLVEKPFGLGLAEARATAALQPPGLVAMVGHLMVYHPAVARLRQLLVSGELGRLYYLHATRVNLGRLRRDENALWSFGPHDLSMIDLLLGRQPLSVAARGHSALQTGVEDVVFMTLRYATGEMAHLHLSWLSPRKERRLTLVCSQKMVEFDDVSLAKLRIYDKGYDVPPAFTQFAEYLTIRDGAVHIPQLPMEEPLRLQLQHFLECIVQKQQPLSDVASAVRVVEILEAAQRSMALDGAPVTLGEVM
ncbi:MAG: Gfo/Idh/MocA family oxidoreductase [Deltaproteobacteria bacterium]|nr:Gfo/Idh/MocA family oxidoreductase [Deltaproteobacteria bacterium]